MLRKSTVRNLDLCLLLYCHIYRWMDGWVRVLRPFNSISVISRRWKGEYERLCAMKRRLGSGRISPPAGFEPATPWSEVGSANRSATRTLHIYTVLYVSVIILLLWNDCRSNFVSLSIQGRLPFYSLFQLWVASLSFSHFVLNRGSYMCAPVIKIKFLQKMCIWLIFWFESKWKGNYQKRYNRIPLPSSNTIRERNMKNQTA